MPLSPMTIFDDIHTILEAGRFLPFLGLTYTIVLGL